MSFDLESIFVVNVLGLILISVLLTGNLWRLKQRNLENRNLLFLMLFSFINCVIDPISYCFDGHPGTLNCIMIYAFNIVLYTSIMLTGYYWIQFLSAHLEAKLSQLHQGFLFVFVATGVFLLIANFYEPVIFSIDENNVYKRGPWFFYFIVVDYGFLVDSLIFYFRMRYTGGLFKTFPLWAYVFPAFIGGSIQALLYGKSLLAGSLAISLAGILANLQNEQIFRDPITNLYNRNYIDNLHRLFPKFSNYKLTGILINQKNFKEINFTYNHEIGDHFSIALASVLQAAAGDSGLAIRYTCDEYLIILKTQDEKKIQECIGTILTGIDKFNYHNPYKFLLSADYCYSKIGIEGESAKKIVDNLEKKLSTMSNIV